MDLICRGGGYIAYLYGIRYVSSMRMDGRDCLFCPFRLLLFARNDVFGAVNRVEKGSQATGVAGVATNKGGVAIGIRVWDTEICFVNAHMAAHQDRTKARNGNYRDIVRGIRIDPHNMDCLTGYHHVFWQVAH